MKKSEKSFSMPPIEQVLKAAEYLCPLLGIKGTTRLRVFLAILAAHPRAIDQHAIEERGGATKGPISTALTELEDMKLIETLDHPTDGRQRRAQLSSAGRDVHDHLIAMLEGRIH
jgi:DNA-binding MarR family transcriptional regulator